MLLKTTQKISSDFLIVGAGIIGLSIAYNLSKKFLNKKICIIEKESDLGQHASGRNSGVLHAGFYYHPESFKAKFTKLGNLELTKYCDEKGLKIKKCGKVVVAKSEKELEILFELKKRGDTNGVEIYLVNESELKDIEPNAKTYKYALWSPTTSVISPIQILQSLKSDLEKQEVAIYFNTPYRKKLDSNTVIGGNYIFEYEILINCAGLYADKIAKDFNLADNLHIVPFKGRYLECYSTPQIKRNIYPVPDMRNPFLGIHLTVKTEGGVKIGPTATPSFWRENYEWLDNFRLTEFIEIVKINTKLFFRNKPFREIAIEELPKHLYTKKYILAKASELVKNLNISNLKWGKVGIRAQLVDTQKYEIVHDFVIQKDKTSIHLLNTISPSFTASFPFTRYVVDRYIESGSSYEFR